MLILVLALLAIAIQGEQVVHMSQEPRHRVVFDSGTVRVQDVLIPPGDTTLYHLHDHALAYVPLANGRTETQALGGEWSGGAVRPPAAAATPPTPGRVTTNINYAEKPVTHRVRTLGDVPSHVIAIGNRSNGTDGETDAASGLAVKPEILNRYYRVVRLTLAPGQTTPPHEHAWPAVVVQQTAGHTAVDGRASATMTAPGAFAVYDGAGPHTVKNTGAAPVDVIEVELRGASLR